MEHLSAFRRGITLALLLASMMMMTTTTTTFGFVVMPPAVSTTARVCGPLFSTKLPEIDSMRAGDMRKELESYGISTKSMLEKSEFASALKQAREEGKIPVNGSSSTTSSSKSSSSSKSTNSSTEVNGSSDKAKESSREERYQEAFTKAQSMKVGDLRSELKARGVSTKSFFEKSEFVKAYADAVADNVSAKGGGSSSKASEEPFDPSYRDVVMQKVDRRTLAGQAVIDIQFR